MSAPVYTYVQKMEMVRFLMNEGKPIDRDLAIRMVSKIEQSMRASYNKGQDDANGLVREQQHHQMKTWDATGTPGDRGLDDWGGKRGY